MRSHEDELIISLNTILEALCISLVLEHPTDLTPSMLLAILESMTQARLPISASIREARTPAARVDAMKIFLGVLESDVIGFEVGLAEVDPRRLARGELDEVVFIGDILCWLARKLGYLPRDEDVTTEQEGATSSQTHNATHRAPRSSSSQGLSREGTGTTIAELDPTSVFVESSLALLDDPPPFVPERSSTPPMRTREHPSPLSEVIPAEAHAAYCQCSILDPDVSFASSASYCTCVPESTAPQIPMPVRFDGWIEEVHGDVEAFEASRSTTPQRYNGISRRTPSDAVQSFVSNPTRHTSPTQHTLALMDERARLLRELAQMKAGRSYPLAR